MPSNSDMPFRLFLSEQQIQNRIEKLACKINQDYASIKSPLILISVLKGAFIFTADLMRHLKIPVKVEFLQVASYEGTASTGHVQLVQDLQCDIRDKHVLLVEDIIDTGLTIDYLYELLLVRQPQSLKICTLLSKPSQHKMQRTINYLGFEIEDLFVVGYGLDYEGQYRELPFLATLGDV